MNNYDYSKTSVLSNRTDAYINENGRLVKIEQGYFYKRYLQEQINYYTKKLQEYEENHSGAPQ